MPDQVNLSPQVTAGPMPSPVIPDTTDIPPMPGDINNLPPVISPQPMKTKKSKVIPTILGILLLIGAVGAGVTLTQQQQDIREKASSNCGIQGPCSTLVCDTSCPKIVIAASFCECKVPTILSCAPPKRCVSKSGSDCTNSGGSNQLFPCDKYGNSCCIPDSGDNPKCTDNEKRCNKEGNIEQCQNGAWKLFENCIEDGKECLTAGGPKCVIQSYCAPIGKERCIEKAKLGNETRTRIDICTDDAWVTNIFCPVGQTCCEVNPVPAGFPGPYYKCCGDGPNPPRPEPPDPTDPPSTKLQCTAIKAYKEDWTKIDAAGLTKLKAGDKIYLTIVSSNGTKVDKAKITIKADGTAIVTDQEITDKKPNSDKEYYYQFTVPTGKKKFDVNGMLHNKKTGKWF